VSNATQPFQARLQFIRVLVSYEGDTVAELSQAFRDAVDDYLSTCESLGREAEVPCKGSFNVRIGHDLHLAASVAATRQSISLNDLTRKAQSEYLEHHA
jgi:predicted HicB family RNase H-like nuclease